jgi:predicted DCC family thiol-disulfide oxidoreductase YuxK
MGDIPHIIVFYDRHCAFCNLCRRFVEKRQKKATFIFRDIGNKDAESIVVEYGTLKLKKFNACLYIVKNLKQPWPLVALLAQAVPERIGDWVYDWVSRHRTVLMRLFR